MYRHIIEPSMNGIGHFPGMQVLINGIVQGQVIRRGDLRNGQKRKNKNGKQQQGQNYGQVAHEGDVRQ